MAAGTLAATELQTMGIGTATSQKSVLAELLGDGLTDQGCRRPTGLHGVVVIGLCPVESLRCRRGNQPLKGQPVAPWMGQQGQAPAPWMRRRTSEACRASPMAAWPWL